MALPTNTGSVSDAQNNPLGLANAETTDFQPTRSEQPQMLQAFQAHPPRTRRKQVCRYFGSKSGCRAGESCPFLHDVPRSSEARSRPLTTEPDAPSQPSNPLPGQAESRQYVPRPVDSSRVAQRPVTRTQVEDPREFQLGQMRRRYSPKEEQTDGGTSLIFAMAPSDPDFPFDIEALECILHVPLTYPTDGRPSLRVTNKQMGRGYQINVERGFDAIATDAPNATLLVLMNKLDKQLETLLSAQKADTIKLVSNVGRASFRSGSATTKTAVIPDKQTTPTVVLSKQPMKSSSVSYSTEQKALAEAKRESEVRQLEARLGRLPLFSKSSDGIAFTIPIEPRQRSRLPAPLQAVKSVKLFVPLLYNLQPCRIQLMGVSGESAAQVELGFEQHASKSSDMSLMSHINFLSQNMHTMAIEPPRSKLEEAPDMGVLSIEERPTEALPSDRQPESIDPDRSHIHVIPRPPEWTVGGEEEDGSSSDDGSLTYDSGDDTEEEESEGGPVASQTTPAERGIMLSFPFLELHGIELLELVSLSITVKCERCKDLMDVERLKNNTTGDYSSVRQLSCKKCASPLGISYRMDMMHANSVRAGYLDLDGCTVVDMLVSNFIPTCSECSTPYAAPGIASVRGESSMAICRVCHRKMTFRIPEVKFLLVSAAAVRASRALPRRKATEKLGIVAGQELPKRGRCSHYSKSYRWFRFSCCNKVFACDKCHDDASDHPNEHANRMICGYCSREQNYRPEDCGVCHSVLVGKRGHGFWEGGKGTRDKTRMSRKDPRKYKRRPGTKPKG